MILSIKTEHPRIAHIVNEAFSILDFPQHRKIRVYVSLFECSWDCYGKVVRLDRNGDFDEYEMKLNQDILHYPDILAKTIYHEVYHIYQYSELGLKYKAKTGTWKYRGEKYDSVPMEESSFEEMPHEADAILFETYYKSKQIL